MPHCHFATSLGEWSSVWTESSNIAWYSELKRDKKMVNLLCICSRPLWCIEIECSTRTCDTSVRLQIESAALQSLVSPASCSPDTKKTVNSQRNERKKRYCYKLQYYDNRIFWEMLKALSICRKTFCYSPELNAERKRSWRSMEQTSAPSQTKQREPPVFIVIQFHHSYR